LTTGNFDKQTAVFKVGKGGEWNAHLGNLKTVSVFSKGSVSNNNNNNNMTLLLFALNDL
jgi:hypothetical protein